ncbi:signal recognition particle-docking protein FtsY [Candidatus Phytoplasma phoenicium]|uniref:Signal recognition particle receptor protein FtsY n=1 Tax=Candidatus Phytoplasma phoenicium TaxID=198422 RepID=A0A0L0MJC7_9MOLU|nr:signal recognition particle-docking protein FtsY [Candidatus Phytoplasma phoenicium]KND62752.1 Signal recognition particle receptor protein FtsY [Candidatus Phytoplasma phoenicium]
MFDFLKKIFQQKQQPKKILGIHDIEMNLLQWVNKIKKKNVIDIDLLQELEILFIKLDMGLQTAKDLISHLKKKMNQKPIHNDSSILCWIKKEILSFYKKNDYKTQEKSFSDPKKNQSPQIHLFVGVNGVGKTTTIGKIAFKLKKEGKKVLLVAGDTFRIGAVEQLKSWSEKTKNEVFFHKNVTTKISPSKILFDALNYAQNQKFDVILFDTSGRLQNNINLMKELEKIKKIINKYFSNMINKNFLILDSMMGQNSLQQVENFNQSLTLNNVILTKFDNISKAGLILSIKHLYNLETKYIGVGEKAEDLMTFDINHYIEGFFTEKQNNL